MNNQTLDRFWVGFLAGIVFPLVFFFFYWMFFHSQLGFPGRFINFLRLGNILSSVIKMCGLGNLVLFYLALRWKMDSFNKGLIVSLFLYIGLIAYVTYYLEPTYTV